MINNVVKCKENWRYIVAKDHCNKEYLNKGDHMYIITCFYHGMFSV